MCYVLWLANALQHAIQHIPVWQSYDNEWFYISGITDICVCVWLNIIKFYIIELYIQIIILELLF